MVVQEKEGLSCEHKHLKRRTEAIMADYEHEKQVNDFFFFYCDRVTISLELLLIIIDSIMCRDSADTQYVTIQKSWAR